MDYTEIRAEDKEVQWEAQKLVRNKIIRRKLIAIVVVVVLILLTFVMALIYGRNLAEQNLSNQVNELKILLDERDAEIDELKNNPIVVNPVAPEINLSIIHSEIREIGELATVEYLFTDAARFTDSLQIRNWNVPLTEKSFTLKWDGVIKAGIKVDEILVEVIEGEYRIVVHMPQAQILSYQINTDSVEVLDEKDNIFNTISVDDKVQFDAKTEEAMKNRAIENGILDKAQENAEVIIAGLIKANDAVTDEYEIEFVINDK